MSALVGLLRFVELATQPYRKGEVITEHDDGSVHVTEITAYPATPERGELVDVHFLHIGFTEQAADKARFLSLLQEFVASGEGAFGEPLTMELLRSGPSYITLGGILGSQDLALRFIALGAHYGLWNVLIPETLGFEGAKADEMAGAGFVMASGWRDEAATS